MAAQICETCKNKGNRCYCAPNSTCGAYEPRVMTHFEKIKAMTLEEMVECHDICPLEYGVVRKYCDDADCQKCRKMWLESEVE